LQENRDHHFGRLFGAEAIIKSSILFQDSEFEQWSRVLSLIFDLGKKKPWLREECGWILYRAIYELASQKIHAKYAESIVEGICSNELAKTPEGVAVWLAVKDLVPTATLPSNVWKYNDPLDRHDRKTLSKVMKESSAADETAETEGLAKNSSGVWNSKLHFAWDAVLARLYESEATDKKSKGPRLNFSDFWVEVVDSEYYLGYFVEISWLTIC
jgi:DNA polymerase phi